MEIWQGCTLEDQTVGQLVQTSEDISIRKLKHELLRGLEAGAEEICYCISRVLKRRLQGWLTYVREWKAKLKENLFLDISTCTGVRIHTISSGSKELERLWNYGDHSQQRTIQLFTTGLGLQRHRVTKFLLAPLFGQILAIPSTGNKDLNFVEMHSYWHETD